MKLSARNQLDGVITEVRKGAVTTIVKIEIRNPAILSASITNEAAEDLGTGHAVVPHRRSGAFIMSHSTSNMSEIPWTTRTWRRASHTQAPGS
jgi:molybdopterin-binding protein